MGTIQFHFDWETRRFFVFAALALGHRRIGAPPSAAPWEFVKMIVDTGSNRTAISEDVARAMGANMTGLDSEPIGGVTGVASRPFLTGVQLRLLGDEPPMYLDRVVVLTADMGPAAGRKPPRRGTNLLGMDVAMKLGARLQFHFGTYAGQMEWV